MARKSEEPRFLHHLYEEIAAALEQAPRKHADGSPAQPGEADQPEGSLVIHLSDTLARQWTTELRTTAARQRKMRFIPRGADQPLPPLPGEVEITDAEVEAAVQEFDRTAPARFRGLLDAEPKE